MLKIDKEYVKRRFEELGDAGKERFQEFSAEGKERLEELKVEGGQLSDRVRKIIEEGKARKITIKKGDRVLGEFPLVAGVGGATAAVILAPTIAAVAAIGGLVTDVSIVIHRKDEAITKEVQVVEYADVTEEVGEE